MMKILFVVGAGLIAFAGTSLLSGRLLLEPTFFAVFYWKNSLDFALGLLGIFLLIFFRLLTVYRPLASGRSALRFARAALLGIGLGLAALAIFTVRVNRPVTLAWFDPASVSAEVLEKAKAHGREPDFQSEPVHDHEHDHVGSAGKQGPPDGGALVKLDRLARFQARAANKPILYYFRADWCPNCPDFERYVLASPVFAAALRDFVLVKMDVTDFEKLRAYVDRNYGVHGTPTVVFRDRNGRIVSGATVNGAHVSYRLFGKLLETVGGSKDQRVER